LYFDKGFGGYAQGWVGALPTGAKQDFLDQFVASYPGRGARYREMFDRRSQSMALAGAKKVELFTASRLAIGLGLPSPIETGFLLDRRTGAPYLPGSSVKGLARATAVLIAMGELPCEPKEFWTAEAIARVFGPETGADSGPAKGKVIFYDAFPVSWPRLEVDILTTHHQAYYTGDDPTTVAADWDEPVPVPFLTVAAGTKFAFYIKGAEGDVAEVLALLRLGLDWLGIGGKKSAGYGVFSAEPQPRQAPQPARRENRVAPPERRRDNWHPERKPPPPEKEHGEAVWKAVKVTLQDGRPIATKGSKNAVGERDQLPPGVLSKLRKGQAVVLDVVVLRVAGNQLRIVSFENRSD
jgi:CRISPR-associated protein Cmr6